MGAALQQGTQGFNTARQCLLAAGLPVTTAGMSVDRQCSSGLMAIATAAKTIICDGVDVAIGGVQKCWAVPPALALGALSARAKARMAAHSGRGWTNDFLSALQFQDEQKMTNITPAIPQMQALRQQLRDIEAAGGMAARIKAHDAMQKLEQHRPGVAQPLHNDDQGAQDNVHANGTSLPS